MPSRAAHHKSDDVLGRVKVSEACEGGEHPYDRVIPESFKGYLSKKMQFALPRRGGSVHTGEEIENAPGEQLDEGRVPHGEEMGIDISRPEAWVDEERCWR